MHSYSGILKRWQKVALLLCGMDYLSIVASYLLALYFRFDFVYANIPREFFATFKQTAPYYAFGAIFVYMVLRLYRCAWRYVGYNDLARCILAGGLSCAGHWIFMQLYADTMPLSYFVFGAILQMAALVGSRFVFRFLCLVKGHYFHNKSIPCETAMLIGAGSAGHLVLRDLDTTNERNIRFKCVIDDDPNKWGNTLEGVPVVGGRDKIQSSVEKYGIQTIYIAIPRATQKERIDILDICKETGCHVKILPGIYQFSNDEVTLAKMRDVQIEDLLGRQPVVIRSEEIFSNISGHVILVTGGGGSIGSELCRQLASHSPKQLIIFDIYENNAYDIQQELRAKYPELDLVVLIGSVRDSRRVESIFTEYHPELVFHAAAHKHVPLMEDSPCEAIKNNVMGTYKVAYAALMHGCRRFLLISTDKAVNPTNIMGASKRLCEMIVQTMDRVARSGDVSLLPHLDTHHGIQRQAQNLPEGAHTEFVAVRFGNVLGSNGSVIPLFKKQIAEGGPVTVTDPRITRYFMTIPEAVSLVLQSMTYAKGGEIFVLDMGEPVLIDTLARNLIMLSGFKPDKDIKIAYTGLRPGEKLYEEKLMDEEGLKKTENDLIHIAEPIPLDTKEFLGHLAELIEASGQNTDAIRIIVEKAVPTYHAPASERCA